MEETRQENENLEFTNRIDLTELQESVHKIKTQLNKCRLLMQNYLDMLRIGFRIISLYPKANTIIIGS